MTEPATLEPITYRPVLNDRGELVGWNAPPEERERWDRGSGLSMEPTPPKPRPLEALLTELDRWTFLDTRLRDHFSEYYARTPERASHLALHVIDGARDGSLQRPDAYLASRLRREK